MRTILRFWLAHPRLHIAALAIGVVGFVIVGTVAPSRPDPSDPQNTELYGWGVPVLVVAIVLFVAGLASLIERAQSRGSRAERIQRLTTALEESMRIIAQINTEMQEGAERLAELERQSVLSEELAKLSSQDAAAVREEIRAEFALERRRSLLRDVFMVLLGGALSYAVTRFL